MIADAVLAARLADFLAPRGVTPEALIASIDPALGDPLLVVATGSVLNGFGNPRSDLDLNVVVDQDKLAVLPIPTFERELLVDAAYLSASEVERWVPELRDRPWPPAGDFPRSESRRRFMLLLQAVRFASGLALTAREGWGGWLAELKAPWLAERVVQWWRIEAVRWAVAAGWLADARPLTAAQAQCEAVLAALQSRAAAAGQLYFKPKWLAEKLRLLGDREGRDALDAALRIPLTEREVPAYTARCEAIRHELLGDAADGPTLAAQLWYAPGVTVRSLGTTTLVSRWDLRGLELDGVTLPPSAPEAPIWEGPLELLPDPDLLTLFREDMTWLSLVEGAQ